MLDHKICYPYLSQPKWNSVESRSLVLTHCCGPWHPAVAEFAAPWKLTGGRALNSMLSGLFVLASSGGGRQVTFGAV